MVKIKKDKQELEVTEKAFRVVYKELGFGKVEEKKQKSEKK